MTTTAIDHPTTSKARRVVFAVSGGLFALMTLALLVPNVVPPLVTHWGEMHFIHDLAFTLFAAMILVGLAAQLRRPRERIAAMPLVIGFPLVFGVLGLAVGFAFPPVFIMLTLAAIATATHPASRELFRASDELNVPTLGLAAVWAVPGIIYALDQLSIQAAAPASDPHAEFGHWVGMGVIVVLVALFAAYAGLRTPGWRIPALFAAGAAVLLGVASIAYGLPSSFGTGWGVAAVVWGLVLGAVTITDRGGDAG